MLVKVKAQQIIIILVRTDISMSRKAKTVVIEEQDEHHSLLAASRRSYPEVFKWKVAAIIISILIAIFLVVNIFMILYLSSHQLRKSNSSFTVELIDLLKTTSITNKQFTRLMGGLASSYDEMWFQKASQVDSWRVGDPGNFSISRVVQFFEDKVTDQLTLIQFKDNNSSWTVGAYTHVSFKVPSTWQEYLVGQDKQFFTFEVDDRQSTLVGTNSPTYLKMDASDANLTNCKILALSQMHLVFLQAIDLALQSLLTPSSPYLKIADLDEPKSQCFTSNSVQTTFTAKLQEILGPVATGIEYSISNIWTYELTE